MKKFKIISSSLILVMLLSICTTVFASSALTSYSNLDVSYRSSTSTFRVTSGYIYAYNTLTTGDIGPNYHLFVSLYSVDNDEIYSTIDVSWPTSAGTKTSTLHWSSVPTGNYKLLFSSGQDGTRYAPVGRVSGTIYDGPR